MTHVAQPLPRHATSLPGLLGRRVAARLDGWVMAAGALAAFAFAIRLAEADQQSAYMDEGTNVITGRMLVEQHAIYAEVLNWAYGSYLWPLVAGLADEAGGLALVRGVTAVCGVIMVIATTVSAWRLAPAALNRDRRWGVALSAGFFMAIAPTAIAVARFGTYDALAGAGFMLGIALLLVDSGRGHALFLLSAALLLFVAFLAKYVVALYFPFICIFVVVAPALSREAKPTPTPTISPTSPTDQHWFVGKLRLPGWTRRSAVNLLWFVVPLTALCVGYMLIFLAPLLALLTSSLHYADLKSPDALREYVWTRPELWLLVIAAGLGWRSASWRGRIIAVGGTAVIAAFQYVARPDFDFWKHSIYVIYFVAPLAALCWLRIPQHTGTWKVVSLLTAGFIGLVAWSPAIAQADRLINFYPNLNPSLGAIQQDLNGSALVLTDDTALRYYLYPTMPTDRVIGPFFFTYQSQDGLEGYRRAIADRYFDTIVLDGGVTPQGNAIRDQLGQEIQDAYQQVYSGTTAGFTVEVYKPDRPQNSAPPDGSDQTWPEAYTFDAGTDGWGVHPDTTDWQPGQQIAMATTPAWNGHPSLEFAPTADGSTLSLRHSGPVAQMRARVYLVSSDGSTAPLRIGFMGFDSNWLWHDDGFRWVVTPGNWTTITWQLAAPGDYNEVGLKLPAGVSQVYVGSFEIDP
jgi:hypothetical protein